jgi:nucleoside-diphosphate-sugar epimerase
LAGVDGVIHLAARVHQLRDAEENPLEVYRKVNTEGTKQLAESSILAGVQRFIFLSTVKVNGEETGVKPFTETDKVFSKDPYALSKWEAEQTLGEIAWSAGWNLYIIRPPLVYGPGVGANFLQLLKWIDWGIPLPLKGIKNKRSMVYVGNLVDALISCLHSSKVVKETFLISDGKDFSTAEWIRMIAQALGKKARLFSLPPLLLEVLGLIAGQSESVKRLTRSLAVDSQKIQKVLDWRPPFSAEEGIGETVRWYRSL